MCLQSNTVVIFSICWQQTSFKHPWKQFYSFCKCNGTRWNCFLRSLLRKSSKHHVWKSKLCCWMTWCFSVDRMMWGARREAELLSFKIALIRGIDANWHAVLTSVSRVLLIDVCVCVELTVQQLTSVFLTHLINMIVWVTGLCVS